MELNGERVIAASLSATWEALNDPVILKACIAGCESLEQVEPGVLSATLALKVGPVGARFNGTVKTKVIEAQRHYSIAFEGQGGTAGFGRGSADVHLSEDGASRTRLHYAARADVGGRLAQVGSRLVDVVAAKVADDFFLSFDARMRTAGANATTAAAISAPAAAVAPESRLVHWVSATVAAVLIALAYLAPAAKEPAQTQPGTNVVAQRVTIEHIRITSARPFADVKAALESRVKTYDDRITAMFRSGDVEGARAELERLASPTGLMILQTLNHGGALVLRGQRRSVVQYGIGNVLTATEMTRHQLAAGLYAPIRVVLYENEGGGSVIEYDKPSSLFGNLRSKEIDIVADRLDEQLQSVFRDATQ
jgi:carbon monoxide dehydrogenase subunit G/uncharacterized protein (DUF302 family)